MIFTAEIERNRAEKEKLSKEERIAKLKKLEALKQQLKALESEESTEEAQIDQGSEEKIVNDDYLNNLENELQTLESDVAVEIPSDIVKPADIIDKNLATLAKEDSEPILDSGDLADVDAELRRLEEEVKIQQKKAAVIVSVFDQLCEEHDWLKEPQYGFMYSMPHKKKQKTDFESWLDEWNRVLFDYARIATKHIIYSKKLLSEKPWSDLRERTDALYEISESLVKTKTADWLDRKKEKLRIYWKSLEEWADIITKWAREKILTEPIMIQDIRDANEGFSNLPEDDLNKIFNIIAKEGYGDKFKLSNGDFAIKIKF